MMISSQIKVKYHREINKNPTKETAELVKKLLGEFTWDENLKKYIK